MKTRTVKTSVVYKIAERSGTIYPYKIIGSKSLSAQLKDFGIYWPLQFDGLGFNYYRSRHDTRASIHVSLLNSGMLLFNTTGLSVRINQMNVIMKDAAIHFDSLTSLHGNASKRYDFYLKEMIMESATIVSAISTLSIVSLVNNLVLGMSV